MGSCWAEAYNHVNIESIKVLLKKVDIAPSIACKWTIQQYLYFRFATQSFFLPYSTADKIQNLKVVAPLSPWEDSQSGGGGGGDLSGGGSAGWSWGWLGFGLWLAAVASSSKAASKLCWMSRSSSLIQCKCFKVLAIHGFLLCVIILLYWRAGAHYLKGNTLVRIWIMLMLWNTP